MALSPEWIGMIFTKLKLTYGDRFNRQYDGLLPSEVSAHWSHELAGVSAEGIKHALANLPRDFPPNVLQFRDLCVHRPEPRYKALAGPAPDPQRLQRELARLNANRPALLDPKAWARKLQARELAGERLSIVQCKAWRVALGVEVEVADAG